MAKKLSITIAGAVSLGSYESGVAFEILDAVAQHNTWADQQDPPAERIEIDVLTGASAGGMTVAMIAQRLLFDGPSMSDPYNNPLYNAWVKDIDISKLLDRQKEELATHSIFSSDCVIDISRKYLGAPYPVKPHPALPSDGVLRLGLAISNLNGVDYERSTESGSTFTYTDHQDQLLRRLDTTSNMDLAIWETIRSTAVACGAFPFAFRVQDLDRPITDYPYPDLATELWDGEASRFFTYTDGGVFQNQPLGMAKNLVEETPDGRTTALQRGYCFVSPQPKTSEEIRYTTDANADPSEAFGSANGTYRAVLQRIIFSIVGQAGFQDWITAEEVNEKIRFLNQRADELKTLFTDKTLLASQTAPVSDVLLAQFPATKDPGDLERAREQLRKQFASDYAALAANTDAATAAAWLDSVLVLELAANLHEKEEMLIYQFVAKSGTLAGEGLQSFEGFFDQRYRQHDYDCGRQNAQDILVKESGRADSVFAGMHWTPQPIRAVDHKLDDINLADVDPAVRTAVAKQFESAAGDFLKELDVNAAERGIVELFINGRIKKLLQLD